MDTKVSTKNIHTSPNHRALLLNSLLETLSSYRYLHRSNLHHYRQAVPAVVGILVEQYRAVQAKNWKLPLAPLMTVQQLLEVEQKSLLQPEMKEVEEQRSLLQQKSLGLSLLHSYLLSSRSPR